MFRAQTVERACDEGYFELAALMIKNGTNVHIRNKDGKTSLHHACRIGNEKVADLLIKNGIDVDARDNDGRTALHEMRYYFELPWIGLLLDNGVSINAQDKNGMTFLHYLCDMCGCRTSEAIELLMLNCANPNIPEYEFGKTPFFMACECCPLEQVELMLKYGAHIDTQDNNGDTPLHVSIKNRELNTAKWLMVNGADLNIKNKAGRSPMFPVYDDDDYDEILDLMMSLVEKKLSARRQDSTPL